jgi:YbgC/YbaW family acyl-CoA thioester hydrolase
MPHITIPIRVPFPDVDSSGRIHFAAMMRYMEVADHELLRSIGFPYASTLHTLALPRVHVSCDYRDAVYYDDLLAVQARVERVGSSSWTEFFTIRLAGRGKQEYPEGPIVAEGRMTIVAMHPQAQKSTPLPADLRAALLREAE